jgi:hypothetical protein
VAVKILAARRRRRMRPDAGPPRHRRDPARRCPLRGCVRGLPGPYPLTILALRHGLLVTLTLPNTCGYSVARDADHGDNRHVTVQLPSWPATPPTYGSVVLREFTDEDAHLAAELGDDPCIPLIGSLPAFPSAQQALEWIHRQRGRLAEGTGLSFAIADAGSGHAVGAIGLWLQDLPAGRATAGVARSDTPTGP